MITEKTTGLYHEWKRIDFPFAGHTATVIFPETPAEGRPWVWRAEFLGAFDSVDQELLRRGWHLVTYELHDLFGAPQAIAAMEKFYRFVTAEFSLSPQCDIFGFSRGGLYAFNLTCAHPGWVSVLYLDAPVLDMRDWPCADRYAGSSDYEACPRCYGMTREEFLASKVHPIDRMEELSRTKVPVVLCAGDADSVVCFEKNAKRLAGHLISAGADFTEIVKSGCDHHPHSLEDPRKIVKFIADRR